MKIARVTANKIYKELEDCDLIKIQIKGYESLDAVRMLEIASLENKIDIQTKYISRKNKWYNKKEYWLVLGFVGGVMIVK